MEKAKKTVWPQEEFFANARGRILGMGSLGYVDERNDVTDVIIGASHGAEAATQLAIAARPRGVIAHDACATVGKDQGGAGGLAILNSYLIAGATVDGFTARMSDAREMYEIGVISFVNDVAARMGISPGMKTKEAAMIMLNKNPPFQDVPRIQYVVHDSDLGRVVALDTVKYADERMKNSVLCMGSHASHLMPRYLADYGIPLHGVITNDCGPGKDNIGTAGLPDLDKAGIPGATVSVTSARVGDARSTYYEGVISALNDKAKSFGVKIGQPAQKAAELMLRAAQKERVR